MSRFERLHRAGGAILFSLGVLLGGAAHADLGPVGQGTVYAVSTEIPSGLALVASGAGAQAVDLHETTAAGVTPVSGASQAFVTAVRGNVGYTVELVSFSAPLVLRTIDLQDPGRPVTRDTLNLPITYSGFPIGAIAFAGTVGYVAGGQGGLVVLDLANPLDPRVLGTVDLGMVADVAVQGDRAYTVGSAGTAILDVSQPGSPQVLVQFSIAGDHIASLGPGRVVHQQGGLVRLMDVSNPSQARVLDVVSLTDGRGLETGGSKVYVHQNATQIAVFDGSSGSELVAEGTIDVPELILMATLDSGTLALVDGSYTLRMMLVGATGSCGSGANQALVILAIPLGQVLRRRRGARRA